MDVLYAMPFLVGFIFSVAIGFVLSWLVRKVYVPRIVPAKQKVTTNIFFRFGGLAVIIGFFAAVLFDANLVLTPDLWGLLFGGLFVAVFGIFDDIRDIHWFLQLAFQLLLVGIVFFGFDVGIDSVGIPWVQDNVLVELLSVQAIAFVATAIWFIAIMNALNWMDGVDGLSAGILCITLTTLFVLTFRPEVNQPPVGILSMGLMGALLGFLIFNFPPAKFIMGTAGIFFSGFIIAYLSVFAGAKIATALLVLTLPVIDALRVVLFRILEGSSPFKPDNRHLHFQLASIGWGRKQILFLFYGFTVLMAVAALATTSTTKLAAFIVGICVYTMVLLFVRRKIQLARLD